MQASGLPTRVRVACFDTVSLGNRKNWTQANHDSKSPGADLM